MDSQWLSLIPPLLAIVLAFRTREPVFSLAVACLTGVLLMGRGLAGFPELLIRALSNRDFVWVCLIEICIGILVAFYQRSGAIGLFTRRIQNSSFTRERTQFLGWGLGLFIFFSDYFSPLFVGPVMRDLTDRARISREKLAYICDSTSAPVSVLAPITGWAVYMVGLLIGIGPIVDRKQAMSIFIRAIPFNFYALFAILLVLLVALKVVPDFGPMRKAEKRAMKTGLVIRPGAMPMMSEDLTALQVSESRRPNIWLNFYTPVLIVITMNLGTFVLTGQARVLDSFLLAVVVLGGIMLFQGVDKLSGMVQTALSGIKGVMPAVLILAFAYAINTVSREMGTAEFIVEVTQGWFLPALLPFVTLIISAFISFATGTSWGTYAIIFPIAVPLAFEFSGGNVSTLVLCTIAAAAGGGVFGDHSSPLSDTTVLSSLGSACDHMDHVKTQLPYALLAGTAASALYLAIGVL